MKSINDHMVAYYGEAFNMANAPVPAAEYIWMVAVIVIGLAALWQARTFVSKF